MKGTSAILGICSNMAARKDAPPGISRWLMSVKRRGVKIVYVEKGSSSINVYRQDDKSFPAGIHVQVSFDRYT